MSRSIRLLAVVFAVVVFASPGFGDDSPGRGRAVLVTGASTGIGRATAELLAQNGFYVYATARKQADLDELDAIENVEAVKLDVTKPEEIAAAVEQVRAGGRGLYGLINNAGVAVIGPLIELEDQDLEFQFDVNVVGPVRVTRAFAPMLIESKGRLSTTGSISGFLAWGIGGPYSMSKHAIEAYTDTLAQELEPFGVQVSCVEPGNYKSQIGKNMAAYMRERGFTAEGSLYEDRLNGLIERLDAEPEGKDPIEVAQAFLHAMSDEHPKRRYMVTPNEQQARMTIRTTLVRVAQLNQDQPYTMSRDELVALLDEALAEVNGGAAEEEASAD